ncbi:Bifunctional protein GAL10 [Ceratocystis fimbriata CBS 114723]|uniref:Bifunctional protein GAL10 n=1 Tax=Ceratocystis fimbriata CBS 114723 TaxID=1035309 RepID=A0A2C5WXA8_9PEZI|nr:Bifunctional protein GAL10 [Ceratocystis fimbriata CBS 114723]
MASVSFLPLGAIIQAVKVDGINIVQGFDNPEQYQQHNHPYFGETIGRVANRIKDATITNLNGQSYSLAENNGPNNLHGGNVGWGKKLWTEIECPTAREVPGIEGLTAAKTTAYGLTSKDGDEGFPGTVQATVFYTAGLQKMNGRHVTVLAMEYEAELTGGAEETVINMTNHSYFNLNAAPTIEGTCVALATGQYLPVDETGIPTSGPTTFPGIAADVEFTLGAEDPDIDDCFVIDPAAASTVPIDTRDEPLRLNLAASHPVSGVHLEVLSTEPSFQFYTGKYIDVPAVGGLSKRGAA